MHLNFRFHFSFQISCLPQNAKQILSLCQSCDYKLTPCYTTIDFHLFVTWKKRFSSKVWVLKNICTIIGIFYLIVMIKPRNHNTNTNELMRLDNEFKFNQKWWKLVQTAMSICHEIVLKLLKLKVTWLKPLNSTLRQVEYFNRLILFWPLGSQELFRS